MMQQCIKRTKEVNMSRDKPYLMQLITRMSNKYPNCPMWKAMKRYVSGYLDNNPKNIALANKLVDMIMSGCNYNKFATMFPKHLRLTIGGQQMVDEAAPQRVYVSTALGAESIIAYGR